ncbi:MAG: competence/damage-inducible protein A [Chthoniobacterales bacterium]
MRAALLTTGTEILLGDVRDSHLSFIAQQVLPLGLRILEQRTVPDGTVIQEALTDLFERADLLFVTGGLGPTTDDITRETVASLLGIELVQDDAVMTAIRERLKKRRIPITDRIGRQAMVPRGATVLPNQNGTAPGFYLQRNVNPNVSSPALFILPGPPRELQPMFRDSVLPILKAIMPARNFERRLYRIANMGESLVERAIGADVLAIGGIELGYCARPSEVDLRVIGDKAAVDKAEAIIIAKLGDSIFSSSDESLEEVLVKRLSRERATLVIAESCTGGLLAHRITNVPGASEVFLAGYVVYSNAAKADVLGVPPDLIAEHGAVSEPVARAMAEGALRRSGARYALATTGIAGPGGGSADKPVGTVFVGMAGTGSETVVQKLFFPNDRETFKQQTSQSAFEMLRRALNARG